jgi:hypothetical protein
MPRGNQFDRAGNGDDVPRYTGTNNQLARGQISFHRSVREGRPASLTVYVQALLAVTTSARFLSSAYQTATTLHVLATYLRIPTKYVIFLPISRGESINDFILI